jgi:predicted nuclease of predicted toxin-antitoxin system
MIRFLLDENFNGKIVRGLRARQADVDMIRVQDTEISGSDDPTVLEWAAKEGRILLTHDLDTMTLPVWNGHKEKVEFHQGEQGHGKQKNVSTRI